MGVQHKSNASWWWLFVIRHLIFIYFLLLSATPTRKVEEKKNLSESNTDGGVAGCQQLAFPFHEFTVKKVRNYV